VVGLARFFSIYRVYGSEGLKYSIRHKQNPLIMKIEKFEDLHCWQAARSLVKLVYLASRTGELARDFDTRNQFRQAALSSMNNIAEGFGRFGRKDFIKFLNISQSSALEVRSMLYVLSDLEYMVEEKINEIRSKADETRNLTLGLIRYLNTRTP
jgi:four helix bundle protein